MTLSATDLALYAGALAILFLTPGPVWMALFARAMSGGFRAAWPLTIGVVVGDVLWSLVAILGISWIVSAFDGIMDVLRWVAAAMFIAMGAVIIRNAGHVIAANSRLTRPGMWAGFVAGLVVVIGNPKAVLFYGGVLPGFFDLRALSWTDTAIIAVLSALVPLLGNLMLAGFVTHIRGLITSPVALRRMNIFAGSLLIMVGIIIPLI